MNTGIAQLVALSAHGNAVLQETGSARELDESPLFRHVSTLSFAVKPGEHSSSCSRPSEWFETFRKRGVTRTRFIRLSANDGPLDGPNRTAFANGEQSGLATIHADGRMELWVPDWQTVPGESGWVLTYRGWDGGAWSDHWNGATVEAAAARLSTVLTDIATFAMRQDLESWASHFDGARELLDAADIPDSMGLLPSTGYPDAARRLLAGALSSWVFGGMGSWNDTGPRDQDQYERYEQLTRELYEALMDSLVSAANAFDPTLR